jgi:hypothetical protein
MRLPPASGSVGGKRVADAARFEDSNPVPARDELDKLRGVGYLGQTMSVRSGHRPMKHVPAFAGRGWLGRSERMLAPTNAPGD